MTKPTVPWSAIGAIAGVGLFLAAAFGGPIVLWRDLGSQISEQGHRLEAKIEAQGDRLEAKIEALGAKLDEVHRHHRQMLDRIAAIEGDRQ